MGKIEVGRLLGRLSPYMIKKGLLYLRHYGPKEFWIRLHERFEPEEVPYGPWYEAYRPDSQTLERQRRQRFSHPILFSICVPVYRPQRQVLYEMVSSLLAQTYPHWQLVLGVTGEEDADNLTLLEGFAARDERICLIRLEKNQGIAGNTAAAVSAAKGEWIGLLDHDDLLAPEALYTIARALEKTEGVRMVYTDEDKVRLLPRAKELSLEDAGRLLEERPDIRPLEHFQPHLKPDFNLDLLRSNNYICHFLLVRRELYHQVGGLFSAYDGAQDYDFIFRCAQMALGPDLKQALALGYPGILHVPEILYHWRVSEVSTADNPVSKRYAFEAGLRCIDAHLQRLGVEGKAECTPDLGFYRVRYPVPKSLPLISLVIPTKDQLELLTACLKSIAEHTTYPNLEILLVENNSTQEETFAFYRQLEEKGVLPYAPTGKRAGDLQGQRGQERGSIPVRVITYQGEFNYSAINNLGVSKARGEYLVLLNNDIEIRTENWLEEMLGVCSRPEVGAVGVRLSYPDKTLQHAGIVVGMGGIAGAMFVDMDERRTGYLHKASILQDLCAVTAACMMVRKSVYEELGGLKEELAVAFNDVDFCLRLRRAGYLVVYDPYVNHIHWESRTRGAEDSKEKVRRFQDEIEYMRSHWIGILRQGDPCYNKNLSLVKWNYSLKPLED